LYLTVPAIAVALEAPIVIIENVPAVQRDEMEVVASATQLFVSSGYRVSSATVAADRLGWAQSRTRFLMVARRDSAPIDVRVVSEALRDEPRSVCWAIGDLADVVNESLMTRLPELSAENVDRIKWLFDHDAYDLPNTERPDCHKGGTTYTSVYGRLYPERPAPTITSGFMSPGRGRFIHPTRQRVLTAREAARLQGFPDTYEFRPANGEPSKAQLGKWIGDAVPMPLGYVAAISALGRRAIT
jgi:DNA (cytosine-5)-methyltransferase 1